VLPTSTPSIRMVIVWPTSPPRPSTEIVWASRESVTSTSGTMPSALIERRSGVSHSNEV
jgi:hypothetical protein